MRSEHECAFLIFCRAHSSDSASGHLPSLAGTRSTIVGDGPEAAESDHLIGVPPVNVMMELDPIPGFDELLHSSLQGASNRGGEDGGDGGHTAVVGGGDGGGEDTGTVAVPAPPAVSPPTPTAPPPPTPQPAPLTDAGDPSAPDNGHSDPSSAEVAGDSTPSDAPNRNNCDSDTAEPDDSGENTRDNEVAVPRSDAENIFAALHKSEWGDVLPLIRVGSNAWMLVGRGHWKVGAPSARVLACVLRKCLGISTWCACGGEPLSGANGVIWPVGGNHEHQQGLLLDEEAQRNGRCPLDLLFL